MSQLTDFLLFIIIYLQLTCFFFSPSSDSLGQIGKQEPSVSSDPTKPEASPSITPSQPAAVSGTPEKTTASPPSVTTSTSESAGLSFLSVW